MKKTIPLMLLIAFIMTACGPSPANDLFILERDFIEFKKSEVYKEFWHTIQFLAKYKSELSNEDYVIAKKRDINSFLTVLGTRSLKCSTKLQEIAGNAKNKKVSQHFYNRANVYAVAGEFWAIDWDNYLSGESSLPNFAQMIDDSIKQKEFYDTELLKLKSET